MIKSDFLKIFIDEIYSEPPMRNYPTNKVLHNHIDEIWSIDLVDMIDYKILNNRGYRYIFNILDNFSKYLWTVLMKMKNSKTITDEFSKILTKSKPKLLIIESDRGAEWYNSVFQNFLKLKNIQHHSRLTDKVPSIAERVFRTIRSLIKKPVFLAGNANWLSEITSVNKQYNNTIHHSITMTPIQSSKKENEKVVYNNLKDNREIKNQNLHLDN